MPRHTFKFPSEIQESVKEYIREKTASVDPKKFQQEANYVAALAQSLKGVAYDGPEGKVEFDCTVFNDRGRKSAESIYGADLAITAHISSPDDSISKAIMVQAKLGRVGDLDKAESEFLHKQINKMMQVTRSPKVMEIVAKDDGTRAPQMVSGRKVVARDAFRSMKLPEYFTARVLTTLDGDTRDSFVSAVEDSGLTTIKTFAQLSGQVSATETSPRAAARPR